MQHVKGGGQGVGLNMFYVDAWCSGFERTLCVCACVCVRMLCYRITHLLLERQHACDLILYSIHRMRLFAFRAFRAYHCHVPQHYITAH
jgi:hypothetical protein